MPIRRLAIIWAMLLAVLAPAPIAQAQFGPQWELLGSQSVGFGVDRDTIRVGRQEGRFSAILLRVQRNDIYIEDLKVVYLNGEVDDLPVRALIRAGSQTRQIDLRGGDRFIREINLVYRSRPSFRGQALVEVYGLPDRRPVAPLPPPAVAGEWELLGSQSVGFGVDHDTIRVGRQDGRFSAIQLRVHRNDVYIEDLKVVYLNGEVDDLPVRTLIRAGSQTRTIDLRGDRFIKEINLVYRSRPSFRGQALVEVYGLQDRRYAAAPPPPPPPIARPVISGGWQLLGQKDVDMKLDRDVVRVGAYEGTFKRIRLKVLNHDIELRDVTIVYGNGQVDNWPVRRRIRDEEEGPVFDLSGRDRLIREVVMTYRATNPLERTSVQVWGLR